NCQLWCLEGAIAVVERDPDPAIAKADDVGPPVAREVGEKTRVHINPPPAGVVAKVCNCQLWCLEGAVAVVERDTHPGIAKADDVRTAVGGQVGEEPRVHVNAPSACVVAEVCDHQFYLWGN